MQDSSLKHLSGFILEVGYVSNDWSQGIPVMGELGISGQPGHRASQWAAQKPHLQKPQCHIRQGSGDMGLLKISE